MSKELDEIRSEIEPNNHSTREIFVIDTRTRSAFDVHMALLVDEGIFKLYVYYFNIAEEKGWDLYGSHEFNTELELIKFLMET